MHFNQYRHSQHPSGPLRLKLGLLFPRLAQPEPWSSPETFSKANIRYGAPLIMLWDLAFWGYSPTWKYKIWAVPTIRDSPLTRGVLDEIISDLHFYCAQIWLFLYSYHQNFTNDYYNLIQFFVIIFKFYSKYFILCTVFVNKMIKFFLNHLYIVSTQ